MDNNMDNNTIQARMDLRLADMWDAIVRLTPLAFMFDFGGAWVTMCDEKTPQAASEARAAVFAVPPTEEGPGWEKTTDFKLGAYWVARKAGLAASLACAADASAVCPGTNSHEVYVGDTIKVAQDAESRANAAAHAYGHGCHLCGSDWRDSDASTPTD